MHWVWDQEGIQEWLYGRRRLLQMREILIGFFPIPGLIVWVVLVTLKYSNLFAGGESSAFYFADISSDGPGHGGIQLLSQADSGGAGIVFVWQPSQHFWTEFGLFHITAGDESIWKLSHKIKRWPKYGIDNLIIGRVVLENWMLNPQIFARQI